MDKILIGSRYFFSCYDDFRSHDYDYITFVKTHDFQQMCRVRSDDECLFVMRMHNNKQQYIEWALSQNAGMVVGKFLIPEVCEIMGMTIEDLPKLSPLVDKLDEKHAYEKIIFDSYIENGAFVLTDEQRLKAYQSYNQSRGRKRVWVTKT